VPKDLTQEELVDAANAYKDAGYVQTEAARMLGLPRQTYQHRLAAAARAGLLLNTPAAMPGYIVKKHSAKLDEDGNVLHEHIQQVPETGAPFELPKGHVVKGISTLVGADGGKIVEWIKTKEGERSIEDTVQALKDAFADFTPTAYLRPSPSLVQEDLLTLIPLADWHIGMHSWHRENGENWDTKIAEKVLAEAAQDLIASTKRSGTAVVLGGGDLIHSDNNENKTARSGNALQVDGRYQKIVSIAGRVVVRTVDAALMRHRKVIVRILPGNHDEHSSVAVAYFLMAWYRNEPRVEVDVDPSLFWWLRFGHVMLGATHGHTVKIVKMPGIMAHRRAEDWGATKFRYIHGFHLHHKEVLATEGNGVISEIHQAPIPQDAWHYGAGYLSGRSMQAITYHRLYGEVDRKRTAILDGGDAPPVPAHAPLALVA
jgi:hypothetical protein